MSGFAVYLIIFIITMFVLFIVILQAINYSDVSKDLSRVKLLLEDIKIRMDETEEER